MYLIYDKPYSEPIGVIEHYEDAKHYCEFKNEQLRRIEIFVENRLKIVEEISNDRQFVYEHFYSNILDKFYSYHKTVIRITIHHSAEPHNWHKQKTEVLNSEIFYRFNLFPYLCNRNICTHNYTL